MKESIFSEPLVITSTINVGKTPYVKINNQNERLLEYLCALISWIKLTEVKTLIFGENSQTDYDFTKIQELAQKEGKILEVLVFEGNKESQWHGKGYGEGKIIKYAIDHSQYLDEQVNFYKITGRLFIPDFTKIQQHYAKDKNVFKLHQSQAKKQLVKADEPNDFKNRLSRIKKNLKAYLISLKTRGFKGPHNPNVYVNASFFKSNVAFYKKNIINSYKRVYDRGGYYLEHAYYDDLFGKSFTPLDMKYDTVGRSGSRGYVLSRDYPDDIKELAKKFINN